ncbi:MAG TPA: menaquinone biosynthesis protein, partial [Bacteroidia bacterium]|nr:menaquinone biosynthesis protein [Bacteroidia bacterium]
MSYLNSKPFIYGLEKLPPKDCELSLDIPSECARKLLSGEVEIGLVPVAVLKSMPQYHIISDYCIGAVGKVDSVKLYSEVPLEKIDEVLLDYQSRTSVALVKILAKELWKINPRWSPAQEGFETEISGTKAAVIIGDRTFSLPGPKDSSRGKYSYEYDLSEAWFTLTGLPFVFAVWASRTKPDP